MRRNMFTQEGIKMHTEKKCMQQNFFYCPDKTFCLSNQNLIDVAKCFYGTTKELYCINTNKICLLI